MNTGPTPIHNKTKIPPVGRPEFQLNMVNFDQTRLGWDGSFQTAGCQWRGAMTSIVSFISNAVFEPADIKLMSDAYNKAIEDVYGFGHPNKIVGKMIAARIITLTKGGERDPNRLCERALAACGFNRDRATF